MTASNARRAAGRQRAQRALLALWMLCLGGTCTLHGSGPTTLTAALIELGTGAGGWLNARQPAWDASTAGLRQVVDRVRRALQRRQPGADVAATLNAVIFDELRFRREVVDLSLPNMLLPNVLQTRRGTCLGLSALYLAIGEQLGLPLEGVLVPGHFFVRLKRPGAPPRNVELLRSGQELPDGWYRQKYGVPPGNPLYLRSLRREEILAVFRYNLANADRLAGRLHKAAAEYERVVSVLPQFAEAQANLGLTHHLLGDYDRAERAYRAAQQASPALPGLARNLAALQRDRANSYRTTAQR